MIRRLYAILALLLCLTAVRAQFEPFSFALLTDIHVSQTSPSAEQDLKNSVEEINRLQGIDFVIVSGDVTDGGDKQSMLVVKRCLDQLRVPYYITSGNHETKWSESGCTDFARVFGSDRFKFTHKGVCFIGFNTGPVIKMSDGHVAPQDISWLAESLSRRTADKSSVRFVIPITHYPLQTGDVDNWFDVTRVLRRYNVPCVIGGHYHRNLIFNCDGIPDVLCRSNLRGKAKVGGYTIVSLAADSIRFSEKVIGETATQWLSLPLADVSYGDGDASLLPDYSCNSTYPEVTHRWQTDLGIGLYAAPVADKNNVFIGDDEGNFYCLRKSNGTIRWRQKTGSRIIGAAAVSGNSVVVGSTDGGIYCFDSRNGTPRWHRQTSMAVMGCPVIEDGVVYIGGSDSCFRALNLTDGSERWTFRGVRGYIETRPCISGNRLFFGAWDCYFYCLDKRDGTLLWKWTNGMTSDKYSPAAVWPVTAHGKVFLTAPDRVFTALDAETGNVVWRTKQHVVRETVGLSEDGSTVFSRCMWDSIVAMDATADHPVTLWKTNGAYGYDHNPSMLIERDGTVIFGTKNGLLFGVDALTGDILWRHKLGNSVLNTICPISGRQCIVSASDGKVTYIKVKRKARKH